MFLFSILTTYKLITHDSAFWELRLMLKIIKWDLVHLWKPQLTGNQSNCKISYLFVSFKYFLVLDCDTNDVYFFLLLAAQRQVVKSHLYMSQWLLSGILLAMLVDTIVGWEGWKSCKQQKIPTGYEHLNWKLQKCINLINLYRITVNVHRMMHGQVAYRSATRGTNLRHLSVQWTIQPGQQIPRIFGTIFSRCSWHGFYYTEQVLTGDQLNQRSTTSDWLLHLQFSGGKTWKRTVIHFRHL